MSAGQILEQFSNLVKHMESIGPKLGSNIRPNRDQLKEIQTLSTKMKAAVAGIETHVEHLLQRAAQRAAPSNKELKLLNHLQSIEYISHLSSSLATTLRKNLRLIFLGPDVSVLDSKEVRLRRDKTRARCEKLRAQPPSLVLAWAKAFQPSTWNHPTGMAENTFSILIEELKRKTFDPISPEIAKCLKCLKEEEPFKNCTLFHDFVDGITRSTAAYEELNSVTPPQPSEVMTTEHQRQDVISSNRKRIAESMENGGNSHEDDRQEKIKLIKRSQEIDYKGSSMPANNLPLLIHRLSAAMGSSKQWKWERQLFKDNVIRSGEVVVDRTDCLSIFVPKDRSHDVSVTLMVGHEAGVALIYETGAQIIRV